jgi:hypothetical protein
MSSFTVTAITIWQRSIQTLKRTTFKIQCSLSFIRQHTSSAQEISEKYGAKDFTIITIKACEQNLYQQKRNINSGYLVAAVGCTLLYLSQ